MLLSVLYFRIVKLARERLLYIFSQSAYFFEKADFTFDGAESSMKLEFPDILVDISNYVDPRLFQTSLHLLNRYTCSGIIELPGLRALFYLNYRIAWFTCSVLLEL